MKPILLLVTLCLVAVGLRMIPCSTGATHTCCPLYSSSSIINVSSSCCAPEIEKSSVANIASVDLKPNQQVIELQTLDFVPAIHFVLAPQNVHWGGIFKTPSYLTKTTLLL